MHELAGVRVGELLSDWAGDLGLTDRDVARWRATGVLHDALKDADQDELEGLVAETWPPPVVHGPACAARLRADALQGRVFAGSIDRVAPVVDPATGTVKVTVATPRQEGLRPGMYVEVELVTAVHDEALLVPKRALVYDNDQVFVFRLKGEERRVERLRVTPLLENADFIEPADGLAAGDQLVVAGQSGLKDNGLVRLPGDPEETEDEDQADGTAD